MGKYKLTWKDLTLNDFKIYLFGLFKAFIPKRKIQTLDDLETFIQTKSAWVSQVTLYGYLKTRMGLKQNMMFTDDVFVDSVNKAKWNIFSEAVADLTFFSVSFLNKKYKTKSQQAKKILEIIIIKLLSLKEKIN